LMVSVAGLVVALPAAFVKNARYLFPFSRVLAVKVRVVELASGILANGRLLMLTYHCTLGAGTPLAAAVKVAFCPAHTACACGCMVTIGGVVATVVGTSVTWMDSFTWITKLTVRVAGVVVVTPHGLVNTVWY